MRSVGLRRGSVLVLLVGVSLLAVQGAAYGTTAPARRHASVFQVRVTSAPRTLRAGRAVAWRVQVTNRGTAPETLTFPDSQRAEVVLRRGGRVRYRWSAGLMFAQIVSDLGFSPGQTRTFVLSGRLRVPAGRYRLVATVTGRPAPPAALAWVRVAVASAP